MIQGWGWRVGGTEHTAAFNIGGVFIWMRNRLALRCFKGWKKDYDWKLERRKFLVNICPSILTVVVCASIYKLLLYTRHSAKLFYILLFLHITYFILIPTL